MIQRLINILHRLACWLIPGYYYCWECRFLYREIKRLGQEIRDTARNERDSSLDSTQLDLNSLSKRFEQIMKSFDENSILNRRTFDLQKQSIDAYYYHMFFGNRVLLRKIHAEMDELLQEVTYKKLSRDLH